MSRLEQNGFSRAGDSSLLAERLQAEHGPVPQRVRDPHAELKTKIHRTCIARLGSAFLNLEGSDELTRRVREIVIEELNAEEAPLSPADRADLERQIADDILGYGPLEPFLQDPTVTEVMVNGSDQVYVERAGRIEETETSFLDDAHLLRIIDRIVSQVGRRIDEASPMVDARLPDGSRVNAIIPPLALRGPSLTIRKFARDALSLEHLVGLGTLTEPTAEFLAECVRGKLNILISGGTGTGKTTLLNAVSAYVPPPSGSSPWRTPPSCGSCSGTSSRSSRARPTSRARARSGSATSSATRSACGPTGSSSARFAARSRSTCCRR